MTGYGSSNLAAWPMLEFLGEVVSDFNTTELGNLSGGLFGSLDVQEDLTVTNQDYDS
jgi:hypothetical protein